VQDNTWTQYSTPNATITTLYSYPVSGWGEAVAVNTSGKTVGYMPHYPSNGKYAASYWTVGVSQFPGQLVGLGTFGSSFNYIANGLNDASKAVGSQTVDSSGTLRAIYWSGLGSTTPTELVRPTGYTQGEAIEISRSGMIVGNTKNSSALWRATRWDSSTSVGVDLGVLGVGSGLQSYGYGLRARVVGNTTIAANGSIVGKSQSAAGGVYHAFITPWNRGISGSTDNLSGNDQSEAHAVNGLGQVVGGSANGATPEHPWIWLNNADGTIAKLDLGTLGGATGRALAINNRGQVVGWSYKSDGSLAAFVWAPGWPAIKELKSILSSSDAANWTYVSVAYGISDDGTVVGYGYPTGSTNHTAFAMKPY
jgi:probable HAF family extracellular repeat protein